LKWVALILRLRRALLFIGRAAFETAAGGAGAGSTEQNNYQRN
jgi:hypothetical protein